MLWGGGAYQVLETCKILTLAGAESAGGAPSLQRLDKTQGSFINRIVE